MYVYICIYDIYKYIYIYIYIYITEGGGTERTKKRQLHDRYSGGPLIYCSRSSELQQQ
jgi:hypothetical protein